MSERVPMSPAAVVAELGVVLGLCLEAHAVPRAVDYTAGRGVGPVVELDGSVAMLRALQLAMRADREVSVTVCEPVWGGSWRVEACLGSVTLSAEASRLSVKNALLPSLEDLGIPVETREVAI